MSAADPEMDAFWCAECGRTTLVPNPHASLRYLLEAHAQKRHRQYRLVIPNAIFGPEGVYIRALGAYSNSIRPVPWSSL